MTLVQLKWKQENCGWILYRIRFWKTGMTSWKIWKVSNIGRIIPRYACTYDRIITLSHLDYFFTQKFTKNKLKCDVFHVTYSTFHVWTAPAPLLYKIETLYSVFFVWSPTPCVVIMNSVNAFARLSAISVTYSTRFRLNMLNFHLWSFP